jgi:hypothetical protein
MRERLETRVTRVKSSGLRREFLEGLRELGVVPRHFGGFGYGPDLLDETLSELGW